MHEVKYICHKKCSFTQTYHRRSIIKAGDVKLYIEQRHFKGDTVQDAVLLQKIKFRLTLSNLVPMCSSRPN